MNRYILFFILFFLITAASADTEVKKIHPDEPSNFTHDIRFSSSEAITALRLINNSLDSFKKITEAAAAEEPIILSDYKNTDWETQNIGFSNAIITVEGALLKQNYLIQKLNYLQAICNEKNGSTSETATVESLRKEFQRAEKKYSEFIEKTTLRD